MTHETHNVEFKQNWRDEYLKWICGFANADGGTILIGKDDDGRTVGVSNAKQLMEDIPNKIQMNLGIVCDVRSHVDGTDEYIEIAVDPSPYPVNYHGEFHYRSGATKQVLKGNALTRFIFDRTGLSWESVRVGDVDPDDLWRESFSIFRTKALESGRMTEAELSRPDWDLLDKLGLVSKGQLNRAGVLLFSHFPEKWVARCYTRIGYFSDEANVTFQDEVHGSLLEQAERVMELLYSKYLVAPISYRGITRVERYAFPREAVRELLCNALIHSNWARGIPIQIKVLPDRLYVSNVAVLPRDLTVEKLLGPHRSEPYNPLIADAFYRAGYIESWGRGIEKIRQACEANGNPMVEFELDDSGVMACLGVPDWWMAPDHSNPGAHQNFAEPDHKSDYIGLYRTLTDFEVSIVGLMAEKPSITLSEVAEKLGVARSTVALRVSDLQERGIVRRAGSRKTGHWTIADIKEQ